MRIRHIMIFVIVLLSMAIGMHFLSRRKEAFTEQTIDNILQSVTQSIPTPDITVPTSGGSMAAPNIPVPQKEIPEVIISGNAYDAMSLQKRTELLKDIQKIVKNEILNQRQTQPIIPGESRCTDPNSNPCPSNKDGSCPSMPDMSQYIRKDAIPCWNCALDY
jgi:hypothetical protein